MPVIPALWEAKVGRSPEVRSSRPTWLTWWNPVFNKNTKFNQTWWHMSVIPATWEAETGELLESGRQRLQWAEITPLHSSLSDRARPCLLKNMLLKFTKHFPTIPHVLETMLSVDLLTNNPVHMPKVSLRGYWHVKSFQQRQLCLFSKRKEQRKNF